MGTITIDRMANRLRMPITAWADRPRVARIFDAALFDLLETALSDAGVDPHEELCLRRVEAFVRVRLSGTDQAVAAAWSRALAEAIRRTAVSSHPNLVRYRSLAQALSDLVTSVSRHDLSRAWAWRQLGLWTTTDQVGAMDAAREVLQALTAHPRLAVAVLRDAGQRGALTHLVIHAAADDWMQLASAVLYELTGPAMLIAADLRQPDPVSPAVDKAPTAPDIISYVERLLTESRIMRGFGRHVARGSGTAFTRSIAALAIAEIEPWRFQDAAKAARLLTATARALEDASHDQHARVPSSRPSAPAETHTQRAETTDQTAERESDAPAMTECGGLLFLLPLVAACDLPRAIIADEAVATRSLRWVLHQLAMLIAGCAAADPAALAFAGLSPSTSPPDLDEPPVSEPEAIALERYAQQLIDRLADLFADTDWREPLALSAWLIERRAEIVGDAGWIEARFSLAHVDTTIRRLGLDLNPDFIPWLGVVVRFTYV